MRPTFAALKIMSIAAADPQRIVWHYALVRDTGWDEASVRTVLSRLVANGWLVKEAEDRAVRARKLYRATPTGLSEARKAIEQLQLKT